MDTSYEQLAKLYDQCNASWLFICCASNILWFASVLTLLVLL